MEMQVKLSRKKIRLILILLIVSFSMPSFGKRIEGYMITNQDDTIKAEIIVPFKFLTGVPKYEAIAYKLKMYEEGGMANILPEDYKQVVLFLNEGEERFYSKKFKYVVNIRPRKLFLRAEVLGPVNVYIHNFYRFSTYTGANGAMMTSSHPEVHYFFEREDGEHFAVGIGSISKKELLEFLPDIQNVLAETSSNRFSRDELVSLVKKYNEWYSLKNEEAEEKPVLPEAELDELPQ